MCPQSSPVSAGPPLGRLYSNKKNAGYPGIDSEAIDKDSGWIEEQRDQYDDEGRIHVLESVSLIADKSQHQHQLVDVIKTVVDTEVRHESNFPFGLIVCMAGMHGQCSRNGCIEAAMAMGQSRRSRVPRFSIRFTARSVYLQEMTGLSRLRFYLLTPKMGWSRGANAAPGRKASSRRPCNCCFG